ncbi:M1 family metallopeptidase [Niabella beijingensis]|uniref:M1 family metallopeptidase n=1 Tax=Niabella beijingensis TaxID=2872700 RepID=UPI001CBA9623|nr:M1 family metallopeptidase [Niabella beijingensis]MBZ4189967.1 M1 family metallopeptidase [Niabella beijingensis]
MKKSSLLAVFAITSLSVWSQSHYNHKEAFAPLFYPSGGNEYRSASGEPGPKYWQNRADYNITSTLDTTGHTVTAKVEITYTNNSPDNLKFLWLQTDQNNYRKDSRATATTTAAGGRWANAMFTEGDVIKSVTIDEGAKKYSPQYSTTDTRTQVWLNSPLKAAGGKLKLTIEYKFTVPEYGSDRMGRLNTKNGWIYEIAQWFPRMAVYDDIQGWNLLPYLGQGEFYLEYGDISFSVTAPANMIVVGSGELLNPAECFTPEEAKRYAAARLSDKTVMIRSAEEIGKGGISSKKGTTTWKFKILNTRDVAWGASNAFILDGAKIDLPSGKKSMALSAYPVESVGTDGWQRSTEMVKGSIEFYSKNLFEFPYPAATNVAGIVGGMEYPGIVFCSYKSRGNGLWGVTDHEFGHTWFPMIVGSNERKYAWMDEGFNTFINDLSSAAFNNGEFKKHSYFDNPAAEQTVKSVFNDKGDILLTAPDVVQQANLGNTAYFKPSLMLHALRNSVLGKERFDAAFREYISRWAFKHPTPWDFFRTMENVGGEDLAWFWRGWVFNNWKIDQSVQSVKYKNSVPANGAVITIENLEQQPMPATVLVKESNGKQQTTQLPVEIWQRGGTYTFEVPTTTQITEVTIDPEKKMFDWDRSNNTWTGQ